MEHERLDCPIPLSVSVQSTLPAVPRAAAEPGLAVPALDPGRIPVLGLPVGEAVFIEDQGLRPVDV